MRWLPFLLASAFLAGCSGAGESPASEETSTDGESRRTARSAPTVEPEDGEDLATEPVSMLAEQVQWYGPLTATYDVTVPEAVERVTLSTRLAGEASAFVDWQVELSGCGSSSSGGAFGTLGAGSSRTETVCQAATPGPQVLTVSSQFALMEGTIELVGWRVPANETAIR